MAAAERATEGHGELIFIAGEPGSGRSHLLGELRRVVEQNGVDVRIVAGGYREGTYVPNDVATSGRGPGIQAVVRDVVSLGASVAGPVGPLLEQLLNVTIDSIALAQRLRQDFSGVEPSELLPRALRWASRHHAVLLLIDDADEAEESWWITLLLNFAQEVKESLPIVGIFTYQAARLGPAPSPSIGSDVDAVARSLESRRLGTRLQLGALTKPEVRDWVAAPLERELLDALWELSDGMPGPVTDAWADWTTRALIREGEDGIWRSTGSPTTLLGAAADDLAQRVAALLPSASVELLNQVRLALGGAALEGRVFTADAVAVATGWDRDAFIDLLDEHLGGDGPADAGIVSDVGGVRVSSLGQPDRTVWRYRFRSSSHWRVARARFLSRKELVETAQRLAEALVNLYSADFAVVAREVAALRAIADDRPGASYADFVARSQPSQAVLRSAAQHYLEVSTHGWSDSDFLLPCEWLLQAANTLQNSASFEWLIEVATRAEGFAQRAAHPLAEARAVYFHGRFCVRLGQHLAGRTLLHRALERSALDAYLQAQIAFVLAGSFMQSGDPQEAEQWAIRAAGLYRRREVWHGLADCWTMQGEIAFSRRGLTAADEFGHRAIKLAQNTNGRDAEATAAHLLGKVALERGELEEARTWGTSALLRSQECGSRLGEAAAWNLIARTELAEGNLEAASDHGLKSLAIQEAIQDHNGMGSTQRLLARVQLDRGDMSGAQARAETALQLSQSDEDVRGTVVALGVLAQIADRFGETDLADQRQRAIEQALNEVKDANIAAACRDALIQLGLSGFT